MPRVAFAQPLQWLGGGVFLTALGKEQRVADLILHRGRKRLQSPKRVAEPHHRFERRWRHGVIMPHLACSVSERIHAVTGTSTRPTGRPLLGACITRAYRADVTRIGQRGQFPYDGRPGHASGTHILPGIPQGQYVESPRLRNERRLVLLQ